MLSTAGDIINDVLVKLNTSTTVSSSLYTDTILYTFLNEAYMKAASAHKWPFTEVADTSLTFASGTETYNYPAGIKTDSVRILTVGTNPQYNLDKVLFQDYLKFRELNNTAGDRIFSDWKRVLYINPQLDVTGTITLYAQKNITAFDRTVADSGNTTIFSGAEEEGNEAISHLIIAYCLMREKKLTIDKKGTPAGDAGVHMQIANSILEGIWKRIQDEQFAYKPKDSSMFKRFDVTTGRPIQEFPSTQDLSNRWL